MIFSNALNPKSAAVALGLVVAGGICVSGRAHAAFPLETLIRSSAGRVILTELSTGPATVAEDRDFNLASAYPQPFPTGGMAGLNGPWARGSAKSFAVFRAWPRKGG